MYRLEELVEQDFGYKKEGHRWGRAANENNSLIVNEETQTFYWFAQQKFGDALDYLISVRGWDRKKALELLKEYSKIVPAFVEEQQERENPVPYEKLVEMFWSWGKTNREYWYDRKLTDKTIDRYQLGYFDGWYVLPLYDVYGNFVNFQKRRDKPEKAIKYWYHGAKPSIINAELLDLVSTVYMTEGTIDSLLLTQEGIPCISQSGGSGYWNDGWFPYFRKIETVYYIADNDKAGLVGARRIAKALGEGKVKILIFRDMKEGYDAVDFFKDGGTAKELKELAETNYVYSFELGEDHDRPRKKRGGYKGLATYNKGFKIGKGYSG